MSNQGFRKLGVTFSQVTNTLIYWNSPNQTYRYSVGPLRRFSSSPKLKIYTFINLVQEGYGSSWCKLVSSLGMLGLEMLGIGSSCHLHTKPSLYNLDVHIPSSKILKQKISKWKSMPSMEKSSVVVTQAIEFSIRLLGHKAHNFQKKSIWLENMV